jgi:hypothetical protein
MDGSGEHQVLGTFLAERDAPCPRCGYNLRGVESAQCPECGEPLKLALAKRRRLGGWGPFLVLVFAWLLIAGGINTTREVRRLIIEREAVIASNQRIAATRARLKAQMDRVQQQLDSTAELSGGIGSTALREFQEESSRQFKAMIDQQRTAMRQQLQRQMASMTPKARPTPTLAQVWIGSTPLQRAGSIWAASLAVLSLLGLLLTAVAAARGSSRVRPLTWAAGTLFLLYAGWHVTQFVRELA